MIQLAPLESEWEHLEYCSAASVPFEEGTVGFKIFSEEEKLGLVQIKFVGDAAYLLTLASLSDKITVADLSDAVSAITVFLRKLGVSSVIFPIQREDDRSVAESNGFDRVSPTLYIFDFPEDGCDESQ